MNVKLSNLLGVNDEYEPQLAYGAVSDYESVYNTMIERTKAAGMSDIIAELQSQADKYISSKK